MNYRREIDGLRTLALIPVLLFHTGIGAFSGGFVGVDIFYVISGYLITGIILSQLQAGTFSLATFYERRARRILPALLVVMACCLPLAWVWMSASELVGFGKSLMAVSLFGSNILFWLESGYFGAAAELKPLLHTWSLAVEQQFYLLIPLMILGMWRYEKRGIGIMLWLIGLLSFGSAHWVMQSDPSAAFYLLPTRAFELVIGAALAHHLPILTALPRPTHRLLRWVAPAIAQGGALVGFALVAFAMITYKKTTPFPGVAALAPTLGTALMIACATPTTWVGRVLATRAMVGIGLISYSTYLWHQPLFVFARLYVPDAPPAWLLLALALVAMGLAYLTWKYVEVPLRNVRAIPSRPFVIGCASISAMMIALGGTLVAFRGFDQRTLPDGTSYAQLDKRMGANNGLNIACNGNLKLLPECQTSPTPEIMVWGDSYAMHLVSGIQASHPNVALAQFTKSSCGPFTGIAPFSEPNCNREWAQQCIAFNTQAMQWALAQPSLKYVVLSSPFHQYLSGDWKLFTNDQVMDRTLARVEAAFIQTLETLKAHGITPIILSPTPSHQKSPGRCLRHSMLLGTDRAACDIPRSEVLETQSKINPFLKKMEKHAKVIWLSDGLCTETTCQTSVGNVLIYKDAGHLTYEGSAYLGKKMDFYHLITDK